jgi:chemotaxis signal transduction protein
MSGELHIVGFQVGRETYGVPIKSLHEIVRVPEITAVPDAPDYLEGVINLRGKIVSVMDLRKRFGAKQATLKKQNRILVVELGSTEDSRRRRRRSACRVSGRRLELRHRAGKSWRTPSRSARHEQTAGARNPADESRGW